MARPPSDDPRDMFLPRVRVTAQEHTDIMANAERSPHATYSEFMRDLGLNAVIIQRESIGDKQLLLALSRLGNNTNQSAKALNVLALSSDAVGDPRLAAEIREALDDIRATHAQISTLIEGLIE